MTISQNATSTGTLTANDGWDPGELESGGMPEIPVPDIRAIDYFDDADFVLQSDGRITNRAEHHRLLQRRANQTACRNVTPPGGTAAFGWTFNETTGWDLSQNQSQLGHLLRRDRRPYHRQSRHHGVARSC